MNIPVIHYPEATMVLNEDMNAFECNHEDAYIEPACCSGRDSDGNISCGCHGQDSVVCPALDCTGIQDWEVDDLFVGLQPEEVFDE